MTNETDIQPLTNLQLTESAPTDVQATTPVEAQPRKRNRRWGKIPSLPTKIRMAINEALREGTTYEQIQQQLAADGYSHITYTNLVHWNQTAFQDWLRDQEKFEKDAMTMDHTRARKIPATKNKNFRAVSQLDIAIQLHNAARQFNIDKLTEHLEDKPETFLRLVHANAIHERNDILRERAAFEAKKYTDTTKKQKRTRTPKQGGVTEEELARLTRRINL